MGRDQNTYAKRQREMTRKRKAEDKRVRRQRRKEQAHSAVAPDATERPADESPSGVDDGAAGLRPSLLNARLSPLLGGCVATHEQQQEAHS